MELTPVPPSMQRMTGTTAKGAKPGSTLRIAVTLPQLFLLLVSGQTYPMVL